MPKVSFITSLYRGEKYLEGFFQSVLHLNNLDDIEIVLVHNDPTDSELDIIESYREGIVNFQHLQVPREGVYESWNRGIQTALGEYVGMWNVDDVRSSEGVAAQVNFLIENPEIQIVTGDYYKIFKYGNRKGVLKKDPSKKNAWGIYPFNNGCFLMWCRRAHEKVGFFDEQFQVAGDWEFWMRITSIFPPGRVNVPIGYYLRESNSGLSKTFNANTAIENYVVKTRYYPFYAVNIYQYLLSKKKIAVAQIINFKKYRTLPCQIAFNLPSKMLSVFLFWIDDVTRMAVDIKFRFLESKRQQG